MPKKQSDKRDSIGKDLVEWTTSIRHRRMVPEQRWLNNHHAWMAENTERKYVSAETSSAGGDYPFGRRAFERSVIRGVDILTPKVKWFETKPIGDVPDKVIADTDAWMWYVIQKKNKSRTNLLQLVRSLNMYERCHLKTSISVRKGQAWPIQRVVDPFCYYVYPETATTPEEIEFCFEDIMVSYEKYMTWVRRGIVDELDISELNIADWPYHIVERMAYQGMSHPDIDRNLESAKRATQQELEQLRIPFVRLTEIWMNKEDQLYQAYTVTNVKGGPRLVGMIESDYDEPTYKTVIHRSLPNEAYTNSSMDDIRKLDGLANDLMVKFLEAVDREQGMVFARGDRRHDSWKNKSDAIWLMNDPKEDALFVQKPVTSTNILRAWQVVLGLVNSLAGAGTIAEGQPGRNMPRAGNAVQSLVTLAMADIKDIALLIEQEILTPSLDDIYNVAMRFIPQSQLMVIPGATSVFGRSSIIRKQDISGNFQFTWTGSQQFQDEQLHAQRMLIFLNMIPSIEPILRQQGKTINVVELIQTIWRYSLGETSLSKIVLPIEELAKSVQEEQLESKINSVTGKNGTSNTQTPQSIGGLKYNLPSVTSGFVQQ